MSIKPFVYQNQNGGNKDIKTTPKSEVSSSGRIKMFNYAEPSSNEITPVTEKVNTVSVPKVESTESLSTYSKAKRKYNDISNSFAQGVVGIPEVVAGIADIMSGIGSAVINNTVGNNSVFKTPEYGYIGKAKEEFEKKQFGYTAKEFNEYMQDFKSKESKQVGKKVKEAEGFFGTAKTIIQNPSIIPEFIAESVPSMILGGGIGRAVGKLSEVGIKLSPKVIGIIEKETISAGAKGAIGEGTVSAGQSAEGTRQQSESGYLTGEQLAVSGTSGVITGLLSKFSGNVAQKLGIGDIDTILAGGGRTLSKTEKNTAIQILKNVAKGGLQEAGIEEMPQSMQEQIASNINNNKPWFEGVPEAGAQGALTALPIGAGAGAFTKRNNNALDEIKDQIFEDNKDNPIIKEYLKNEKIFNDTLEYVKSTKEIETSEEIITKLEEAGIDRETATQMIDESFTPEEKQLNAQNEMMAVLGIPPVPTEEIAQVEEPAVDIAKVKEKITNLTKDIPKLKQGSVEKKNAKIELETERAKLRTIKQQEKSPVVPTILEPVEDKPTMPIGDKTSITFKEKTTAEGDSITSVNKKVSYKAIDEIFKGRNTVSGVTKKMREAGVPEADIKSIISRTLSVDGQTFNDNVFDAITAHNDDVKKGVNTPIDKTKQETIMSSIKTAIASGSRISAITNAIVDQYGVSKEEASDMVDTVISEKLSPQKDTKKEEKVKKEEDKKVEETKEKKEQDKKVKEKVVTKEISEIEKQIVLSEKELKNYDSAIDFANAKINEKYPLFKDRNDINRAIETQVNISKETSTQQRELEQQTINSLSKDGKIKTFKTGDDKLAPLTDADWDIVYSQVSVIDLQENTKIDLNKVQDEYNNLLSFYRKNKNNESKKELSEKVEENIPKTISKSVESYIESLPNLQQTRAKKTLYGRSDKIEKMLDEGYLPKTAEVNKIQDASRTVYNRMNQQEQDMYERKQREAGKKTIYLLALDNRSLEITKTEYNYLTYLLDDTVVAKESEAVSTKELSKNVEENIPKTISVWIKSKFSNDGAYADVKVIRKVENITLYQGGGNGKRQFWTPDKKYAETFGDVIEKTGTFYKVDNGNRVTDVYVELPTPAPREKINVSVPLQLGYKGSLYNKDFTININGDISYNGEVIAHIYDGQITAKQIEDIENDDKLSNGNETFSWDNTPDTQDASVYQEIADSINKAYSEIKTENDKALLENYNRVFPEKTTTDEAPTPVPTAKESKTKITDVGEKIGGAKKDLWGKAQESYSMNFTDAEIAKRKLSELFPKLDYKKLSENGVPEGTLMRIAWANALIAKKPVRSYAVKTWVEQVKVIRKMIQDLLENQKTTEHFNTVLDTMPSLKGSFDTTKQMYKELDFINNPEVAKYTLSSKQYTTRVNGEQKTIDYYTISKQSKSVKSFYPEDGQTFDTLMSKVKDYFTQLENKKGQNKGSDTEVDIKRYIGLYNNRLTGKVYSAYKKGKTFFEFETFNNIDEARTLYKTPERITQYIKQLEEAVRFDEESFRTGEAEVEGKRTYRTGNISAEEFQNTFGFRGVEFGNWVNQVEREIRLNKAYDSFKDLASILGIPDQAISLNGELGFAFGARGSKGALAHYESGKVVINITKLGGAGTLAHEWFHALDNYLSRRDGSAFSFATEDGYNRAELDTKLKAIVDYIKNGDIGRRSQRADNLKNKVYYGQGKEMTARGFEVYVKERLTQLGLNNTFLVSLLDAKDVKPEFNNIYPYAVGEEITKVTQLYQDMVDTLMNREEEGKVALYKYKSESLNNDTPTVSGAFLEDASKRLKVDFDYKFFDTILGQNNKQAWGVTLGNSIALERSAPFITERHEFAHFALKNLKKIGALKHLNKYDILMEQTKKMGLPIEMYDTKEVEESLVRGIETYEKGEAKLKSDSKIKQFYDYLIDQFSKILRAIGLSNGNLINEFYDILLYEESVDKEYVDLSNGKELDEYINDTTLDLSTIPDIETSNELEVKMKEKIVKENDRVNKLINDIQSNKEVMSVISDFADGKPLTKFVQIANNQIENYVKAVLEIDKIKQDITDSSELFAKLVAKRENIEDLQKELKRKLTVIGAKIKGTRGRAMVDVKATADAIINGTTDKIPPVQKPKQGTQSVYKNALDFLELEEEEGKGKYDKVTFVDQLAKAITILENNEELATDIALGKKKAPEGVIDTSISVVVQAKAIQDKNWKLFKEVAEIRSEKQTERGQEIVLEKLRNKELGDFGKMYTELSQLQEELTKAKFYKNWLHSFKQENKESVKKFIKRVTVKEKVSLEKKLDNTIKETAKGLDKYLSELAC